MKARPTFEKRRKEKARQDKKREKAEKREQRKLEKDNQEPVLDEDGNVIEDPDIAGIVPGPQPLPPEFGDFEDDASQ